MQPPFEPSSQISSSRRVRAARRPQRYVVRHRPRRVIAPRAFDEEVDGGFDDQTAEEYSQEHSSDAAPRQAWFSRLAKKAGKRLRRVRFGPWEWIGLGASALACALLAGEVFTAQHDHQRVREQMHHKEAQLAALQKQQREQERQLAYLQSEKGREQILIEHGYLKPGDRILLFPSESEPPTEND